MADFLRDTATPAFILFLMGLFTLVVVGTVVALIKDIFDE